MTLNIIISSTAYRAEIYQEHSSCVPVGRFLPPFSIRNFLIAEFSRLNKAKFSPPKLKYQTVGYPKYIV